LGKTIASVRAIHPSLKRKLPSARARRVKGKRIASIERRGKHQLLQLESGDTLVVHFRMNGDWEIGTTEDALDRFARAVIELTDGTRISLVDRRALSSITLDKKGSSSLPRLGREASDKALDADYLLDVLRRKKIAIKPALMDQSVLAGLGNIYAAEALWEAELNPRTPASKVSRLNLEKLVAAIRLVLSPKKRRPGRYTATRNVGRFAVYDREGEVCRRCGGTIERIVQAGRSTYFCPDCQLN
jgi:formamidopyrimidine-DNA glycosylase